jgi:predicted PurR-regulated permease PerM
MAGVVYPLARWAAAHKIPKGIAVILFYLFLFGLIIAAFALLIPALFTEVGMFAGSYGKNVQWMSEWMTGLQELSTKYGFIKNLQTGVVNLQSQLLQGAGGVVATIGGVFDALVGIIVVLVLSFYIIVEESAVKTLFQNVIPNEYQEFASDLVWRVTNRLGDWLRGQVVLGVLIGLLYFIAFTVIGLPYSLLLALFGGLLEFIPYVGPLVAGIPAVIIAATISPLHLILTIVAMLLIQQIENNIVVPKVMERAVGLNPIMSIIAVLIGAQLFGIVGALFAIPVATAISVVTIEFYQYRKRRLSS